MTDIDRDESILWRRFTEEIARNDDPKRPIPLARLASDSLPMHKERAVDIIGKWENNGWVATYEARTWVIPTDAVLRTEHLEALYEQR